MKCAAIKEVTKALNELYGQNKALVKGQETSAIRRTSKKILIPKPTLEQSNQSAVVKCSRETEKYSRRSHVNLVTSQAFTINFGPGLRAMSK